MVPVWKEKIRLNAVFVNNYKKCFVTAIEVCIALNIWIYLILCPWLGLPYNINSSRSWRIELIMIFVYGLKKSNSTWFILGKFEKNNDKHLNSTEFAQLQNTMQFLLNHVYTYLPLTYWQCIIFYMYLRVPKLKSSLLFLQKYEFNRLWNEEMQEACLMWSGKSSHCLTVEGKKLSYRM